MEVAVANPTQINQGDAENQEKQPRDQTGAQASGDQPTDGKMSQKQRDKMQRQEKAEGERR
jgi:hypothetical protein